ncbi:MAG: metallophosphoesterase family protein [Polyangiaceae bacterium]|nr:metallophosphoesterase family protein [Polyangiaceae bacterium]
MRLLCLSDIHGHDGALAAVLATAEKRGYTHLLVAGDLCFPGPGSLAVWQRLVAARAVCVQGLSDRALAKLDPTNLAPKTDHEKRMFERFVSVRRDLGDGVVRALGQLPSTHRMPLPNGDELLLVHGSPADPTSLISHDMSDDEVRRLLGDDPADIVVCGGTHVPFDRVVMDVRIIGVGSVGEAPGDIPHAHATFIDFSPENTMSVDQITVPLG